MVTVIEINTNNIRRIDNCAAEVLRHRRSQGAAA